VLDVVFGEDQSHAAANLATLRRRPLNLLRADTRKAKRSIKATDWDHNDLLHFLGPNPNLDA